MGATHRTRRRPDRQRPPGRDGTPARREHIEVGIRMEQPAAIWPTEAPGERASCSDAGDADRGSTRVLRERGDIGSVEHDAPALVELAGSSAGEGLSRRRLEVGRQFAVECCRDDPASPGADVDVPLIAKPRDAVAEFAFDADLENVCTLHDMTQQHETGRVEPSALAEKCTLSDPVGSGVRRAAPVSVGAGSLTARTGVAQGTSTGSGANPRAIRVSLQVTAMIGLDCLSFPSASGSDARRTSTF